MGPNEKYMRHLVGTVRAVLGDDLIIYTTDPPPNIAAGSLADDSVYRQVSISRYSFPLLQFFPFQDPRVHICSVLSFKGSCIEHSNCRPVLNPWECLSNKPIVTFSHECCFLGAV